MTMKRYRGSCHCGAVRYEAEIDLSQGTNRCNCSLCSRARAWFCFAPAERFHVVAGEESMSEYRWTPPGRQDPALSYRFCSHCGIRLYATGEAEALGGKFYALHVPTIEGVDPDELASAPLNLVDGAHDRFTEPPADTRLM